MEVMRLIILKLDSIPYLNYLSLFSGCGCRGGGNSFLGVNFLYFTFVCKSFYEKYLINLFRFQEIQEVEKVLDFIGKETRGFTPRRTDAAGRRLCVPVESHPSVPRRADHSSGTDAERGN